MRELSRGGIKQLVKEFQLPTQQCLSLSKKKKKKKKNLAGNKLMQNQF